MDAPTRDLAEKFGEYAEHYRKEKGEQAEARLENLDVRRDFLDGYDVHQVGGQTIGKMATGIRVVKTDRTPMDIFTAIMREVVLKSVVLGIIASITFSIAYLVDWLWPLFDDENLSSDDTRLLRWVAAHARIWLTPDFRFRYHGKQGGKKFFPDE